MTSTVRSVLLAVLIVTGLAVAPARAADTVTAQGPVVIFPRKDPTFVVAVCSGHASSNAAFTRVRCQVAGTEWIVSEPEGPSPVFEGRPIHNMSDTTMSGPASASVWVGNTDMPVQVCTIASATFNRPTGPPVEITDDPECITIQA